MMKRISTARPSRESDPLSVLSFGAFLIIVALVVLLYPDIFSDTLSWLRSWEAAGPTVLPANLTWPLVLFFSANGVWGLAMAAIRVASGIKRRRSVSDAFAGAFLLIVAFLFREYAYGLISLIFLIQWLFVSLGAMILLGSATAYLLRNRL